MLRMMISIIYILLHTYVAVSLPNPPENISITLFIHSKVWSSNLVPSSFFTSHAVKYLQGLPYMYLLKVNVHISIFYEHFQGQTSLITDVTSLALKWMQLGTRFSCESGIFMCSSILLKVKVISQYCEGWKSPINDITTLALEWIQLGIALEWIQLGIALEWNTASRLPTFPFSKITYSIF